MSHLQEFDPLISDNISVNKKSAVSAVSSIYIIFIGEQLKSMFIYMLKSMFIYIYIYIYIYNVCIIYICMCINVMYVCR